MNQARNTWLQMSDSLTMNRTASSSRNRVHPGESPLRSAPHHPPHHLLTAPQHATSLMSLLLSTCPSFSCHISTTPGILLHFQHIGCHLGITPASPISPATLTLLIGGDRHPKYPPMPFPNPTHAFLPTSAHSKPHWCPFHNPYHF